MKRLWMLAILLMVLAGCGGSAAPSGGQCNQGLCVKIQVAEPIRWGEPVTVMIATTTDKDIPDLGVSIFVYPPNAVVVEGPENWEREAKRGAVYEGGAGWRVTTKASQPITFTRIVHLPHQEGFFEIMASVTTIQGMRVTDSARIYLTRAGGKVYYSGTPVPTPRLEQVLVGRVRTSEGVDCSPGPCLTIRVVEPVHWGEPVRVLLQVEGRKKESVMLLPSGKEITIPADFPQLGLTFSSPDPSVQIKPEKGEFKEQRLWPAGNGVWWITDVWANSAQEYAFLVTFPPKEGAYQLHAEGFDPRLGQVVSSDFVHIELRREGGKVFAPSLGTPFPTATPWPTPFPTPTSPPPVRTPTPTQLPSPFISPISTPTPAAYP